MPRNTRRSSRTAPKKTTRARKGPQAATTAKTISGSAEARVKAFIESGKPAIERAQALVTKTGRDLSRQTQALRKDLAHRVADLGKRVEKERKSLGLRVEGTVKTTLASLNIPTRSEINLLARRVEELSRKIDSLKRR